MFDRDGYRCDGSLSQSWFKGLESGICIGPGAVASFPHDCLAIHASCLDLLIQRLYLLDDVAPLTHVQAVQELPDILVPHSARLLDVRGALTDGLQRVAGHFQLILDVLGRDDIHTCLHVDSPDEFLANEVPKPTNISFRL